MNKKGIEMTLGTVAVAALLLFLIAVILWIVGKNIGVFNSSTSSCIERGGDCKTNKECTEAEGIAHWGTDCSKDDKICCVPQT